MKIINKLYVLAIRALLVGLIFSASMQANAAALDIGAVVNGTIATPDQIDDYQFTSSASTTLFFDVQSGSAVNFFWQLTAPDSSLLFPSSSYQDNGVIILPADGQYTLTVSSRNNGIGSYQFQVIDVPPTSSNAININQVVVGEIALQGEEDEFSFNNPSTQFLYLDVQDGATTRLAWTLTDDSNNEVASSAFWYDLGPFNIPAGNYVFKVDGRNAEVDEYQFIFVPVPSDSVTDIGINEVVNGEISVQGEVDQYRFTVEENDVLFFDAQIGSNVRIDWVLYDANSNVVFNDPYWGDQQEVTLSAGEYLLEIDGRADATLSYQFQIVEIPDTSFTAIELNDVVVGDLQVQGELDSFTFVMTQEREIFFDRQIGSNFSIDWFLVDSQGTEVFRDASWGDIEPILLPPDEYTLTVDGRGDATPEYQFQLHLVPETVTRPIEFYFAQPGFISIPGERQRFTIDVPEPMDISVDKLGGGGGFGYSWSVFDENDAEITGSNSFGSASGNITGTVTQAGTYTVEFDGNGDTVGIYNFRVWPVHQPETQQIVLDQMVSGRLSQKGQVREYQFTATQGEPLFLNVYYRDPARPNYSLYAPDGSRLINNRNDDTTVNTLPESGIYTLRVTTTDFSFNSAPTESYSFQVSSINDQNIVPDAAELVVTSASAIFDQTAQDVEFEVTWTVTNNGSVTTNVDTWKDRILFYSDDEFRLIEGSISTPFEFEVKTDLSHIGALAPSESYTTTTTIPYDRDDADSTTFDIIVDVDFENQVFEASSDLNQFTITPSVYLFDERLTTGTGAISTNIQDGSVLPSNVPIALAGNANLSGGSVNVYFVIDSSHSTTNPFNFDANGDGVVNGQDDINGDGRNGDVLDVELGAVITLSQQFKQTASDVLVSVVQFGGEAEPLDLSPSEFRQTFQAPDSRSFGEATELQHALTTHIKRVGGTSFGPPLVEVLAIAQNAPPSDQNFLFFLTDGAGSNATNEQLDALGSLGFSFFAFQIGSSQLSAPLQSVVDGINSHPNSTAIGLAVGNPGDLPGIALGSIRLDKVEIDGQAADALDAAGNFFKTVTLSPGDNLFTIAAIDIDGNRIERVINLIGASTQNNDSPTQVASQGDLVFSGTFFNRATNRLYTDSVLQNNSAFVINDTVEMNLDISPAAVKLDTADRVTNNGQAVIVIDDELGVGLALGEQSEVIEMIFSNPRRDRFSISPSLLTALNNNPYFASSPQVFVNNGATYSYNATALDDDDDMLSYSLRLAPIGMTVNSESGNVSWAPGSGQSGTHQVALEVADGKGGLAEQAFQVSVTTGLANLPPYITSSPITSMLTADGYTYQVIAVDPEANDISYSLVTAAIGLSIDSSTGRLLADPNLLASGSYAVTVNAADTAGGQAQQSWTLDVKGANQTPQITSTAPESTSVQALYSYAVQVVDDDTDITFELLEAPAGMSINSLTGVISITSIPAQIGQHLVRLKVTDPYDASAQQSYTLVVSEDAENPQVSIVLAANQIALGDSLLVSVNATDNVGLASVNLLFNNVIQPLDINGSASITPTAGGLFTLVATVVDTNGLTTQEAVSLRVVDTSDITPPSVAITGPSGGTLISALTDIIGSVEADDLFEYRLEYAFSDQFEMSTIAADGAQWTTFARGGNEVNADVLGAFDATLVRNDSYAIRLVAEDYTGNRGAAVTFLEVNGASKLGEFQLAYTDLSITVSNIPIEIKRIYQTTHASVNTELGYGWRMQLSNPDVRETVPVAYMEESLGLFVNNPYLANTRVYFNAPDGSRIGFTFEPSTSGSFFGSVFIPKFTPDPGTFYELEVDPISLSQSSDGSFVLFFVGFNYNPQDFRLIEPNGTTWHYNQFRGLERVTDRLGNELEYRENGIFHSSGLAVTFDRDDLGRITKITDTVGGTLEYAYSASGELTTFTDQNGDTEYYDYMDEPLHFMDSITDTNGNVTLTVEFDDDGRLSGLSNGVGNRIEQDWSPETFSGNITDAKGQVTLLTYDLRGNILIEQDPEGGITQYTYDANDNQLTVTDANGNTTNFAYDELGNVKSETDSLGNVSLFGFDEFGNRTSVENALGNTTSNTYDEDGNLLSLVLDNGNTSGFEYDEEGRLISMTDFEGNQTSFEYAGSFVTPTKTTLPDGNIRLKSIDNLGLISSETDEAGFVIQITRDAKGRMTGQVDSQGNQYAWGYSGNLLTSFTDPSGRTKLFEYDGSDRHIKTEYLDGSLVFIAYDENGNISSNTDSAGNVTSYAYDANDRMISRTDAAGETEFYAYDPVGNIIQKTDRRGNIIEYGYDPVNRMTSETWKDSQGDVQWQLNKTFDAIGNVLTMDDGYSLISNTYNANNLLTSHKVTINSGPDSELTFSYDGNDKLIGVSDSASSQSISYNSRQFVEQLTLSQNTLQVSTDVSYDPRGLRSTVMRSLDGNSLGNSEYTFDSRQLSESITHDVGSFSSTFNYVFDNSRLVSSQQQNNETFNYLYDQYDQITEAQRSLLSDETYSFDVNGNPDNSGDVVGLANRLESTGDIRYTYDTEGNLITRAHQITNERTTFTYDHRNRLTHIQVFDGSDTLLSDIEYAYDAQDRRIMRRLDSDVEYSNYALNDVWTDMSNDGSVMQQYLNGDKVDEKVARISNNQVAWYLTDRQQTVHNIVDSSGSVINELDYDSFGYVLAESNPSDNDRFSYTGRELQREADVYNYRSRTYDPIAQRFTSEDPLGFDAGDTNLYRYVFNNPLQGTDPTGETAALEYGQILCSVVVPQVAHYKALGSCLGSMYESIAKAVEELSSDGSIVPQFGKCVINTMAASAAGAVGGSVNSVGAGAAGAYMSMNPPDGGEGSPGDALLSAACGAAGAGAE